MKRKVLILIVDLATALSLALGQLSRTRRRLTLPLTGATTEGDSGGSKYSPLDQINRKNVAQSKVAQDRDGLFHFHGYGPRVFIGSKSQRSPDRHRHPSRTEHESPQAASGALPEFE